MVNCKARHFDLGQQNPDQICNRDGSLTKKAQILLHPTQSGNADCVEEAQAKFQTATAYCEKVQQGGGYDIRDFDQNVQGVYFNRDRKLKLSIKGTMMTIATVAHNLPVVFERMEKIEAVPPRWRISIEETGRGHFWASRQNIVGKAPYYTVTWPKDVEWKIPVAGKVEAGVKGIKFWPQGVTPPS